MTPPKSKPFRNTYGVGAPNNVYGDPEEQVQQEWDLTAQEVTQLHRNADTDTSGEAIHHTLGHGRHQAARGDHKHLEGVVISGYMENPLTVLPSIVEALVALGATDATT